MLEVSTGDVTLLTTALDRHCLPYLWGAREPVWDGDYLWFTAEDRGNQPLYRVHADPTEDDPPGPELMVDGDRVVTGFDVAQRRRRLLPRRRRRRQPSCRCSSTASRSS